MTNKQKIIAAVVAIGIALIALFFNGLSSTITPMGSDKSQDNPSITQENSGDIKVTSMNPVMNSDTYLLPLQPIEMHFNTPLESRGELKVSFSPEVSYDVYLTNNDKTAKIVPQKPYPLDQDITMMIKPDSKFSGGKTLGRELIYHFRTISYKGV